MTLATIGFGFPFAVFLLVILTVVARSARTLGPAGGALRVVLSVFYALVVLAGVGGLALAAWIVVATRGAGSLLAAVPAGLALFMISIGTGGFRFVLGTPPADARPVANSSGWEELDAAAARARNAGVAPHLQPAALRRTNSGADITADPAG
jgi:hypothetical protein